MNVDPQETVTTVVTNTSETAPPIVDADVVRRENERLKEENQKFLSDMEQMKLKGHREKEDWKSVAEHHEQKAKDYETKYEGLKKGLINEKKTHALVVEAQKHGINPQSLPDLELLDFEEISVETTSSGKILVSGQDRAIARLKTMRPHWFTTPIPSVNTTSPNLGRPNSDIVTMADLTAAEEQWKKTKSESDKKHYFETIQKYKSQR